MDSKAFIVKIVNILWQEIGGFTTSVEAVQDALRESMTTDGSVKYIEAVFAYNEPVQLSTVLGVSHALCTNCCDLYTPCRVSEFEDVNPELFDSEVGFFSDIIKLYSNYIVVDIDPFGFDEVVNKPTVDGSRIAFVSHDDRIRQLYTLALFVNSTE